MDRRQRALAHVDRAGSGLEIGASYNPIAPKSLGYRVKVLDHADQQSLREKYDQIGLDSEQLDRIEEVDFVWQGGSLREAVTTGEVFDYILAAHVVEHTVDLINFLDDCGHMLADGGVVSLVVPDKRFCFDHFRPLTSAGEVVENHLFPRPAHGPASFIDLHLYQVRQNGSETWDRESHDRLQLVDCSWQRIHDLIGYVLPQDTYIDIHRWVFTPASFELLVHDLRMLGYLDVEIQDIRAPGGFEFFVALRKSRPGAAPDAAQGVATRKREVLLARIEQELTDGRNAASTSGRARLSGALRRLRGR